MRDSPTEVYVYRIKRPLLCGCLVLAAAIVFWQRLADPPPWESRFAQEMSLSQKTDSWDELPVTVTGQIYKKEVRTLYGEEILVLYLKSVAISSDTRSGDEISVSYHAEHKMQDRLICQLAAEQPAWEGVSPEGEIMLREQVALGSRVALRGQLQLYRHATNPGEWDSADYYLIEGVAGRLKQARLLGSDNRSWRLREILFRCRRNLTRRLYQALPAREASVLAKMLLGENSGLDRELKTLYQDNGIAHVLAISGLHISLLGMGLYGLLRRFGCPIIPAAVLGGGAILLYGGMVGWGVSAVRAIGMYLIRMLGEIGCRRYDMLTAMGVLAAGMLCHNPRLAYHCGFLLSFGAVAGMGWVYPALLGAIEHVAKRGNRKNGIGGKSDGAMGKEAPGNKFFRRTAALWRGIYRGLLASLSVTLATLPVQLWYFYQIPVYGTVLNLVVLPLMGLLLAGGLTLMVLPGVLPVRWMVTGILALYEEICRLAEGLPGHLWIVGRPGVGQIAGYYGILTAAVILLRAGKRRRKCPRETCGKWGKRYCLGGLAALSLAVLSVTVRPRCGFSMTMLDVGQGDCVCVHTAMGQTYLFDGGSSSRSAPGEYVLIPYLKYRGVGFVDGIFLSHGDQDHISAVRELLTDGRGIRVGTLYLPQVAKPLPETLEELRDLALDAGCHVEYLSQGMGWQQGDFRLTCLWPRAGYQGESNASSACYLLEEGDFSILLTGDVEGEGERELAAYLRRISRTEPDVLKVAHHGSRYSTTDAFLRAVTPRLALISAGRDNSYGHPHRELLERLLDKGCTVAQTPESGAITIQTGSGKGTGQNRGRILTFIR